MSKSSPALPGKNASTDQRLEYLTTLVTSLVTQGAETRALLEETRNLLTKSQERVATLETTVTTLSKELRYVQTIVNNREQFDRSLLVRVIGLPPSEEESNSPDPDKFIAKKVYDRILQPILAGAKASGSIKSIPSLTSVITSATRHGRYNPKGPAANSPILITLQDSAIKSALFRAKKNHLPTPTASEQAAGTIRFLLAEDLTFPNFSKLKQLREHKKVDRAWSVEGKLRYTLIDDKDKIVRKVASVFEDPESILS